MKGPHTFDEWKRIYEARNGSEYGLEPGEREWFDPARGFFTYMYDPWERLIFVPKMCGDGKYMRKMLLDMAKAAGPDVVSGVYCCTKRKPEVFLRATGGRLVKRENGYSYILISWGDTKTN